MDRMLSCSPVILMDAYPSMLSILEGRGESETLDGKQLIRKERLRKMPAKNNILFIMLREKMPIDI